MDLVSCSPFIRVGGAFVVVLPLQLFDKRIACLVLSLRWYSFGQRSCHTQRFCTSSRHGHVEAGSNSLPGWATEKVELSPNGNVVAASPFRQYFRPCTYSTYLPYLSSPHYGTCSEITVPTNFECTLNSCMSKQCRSSGQICRK
jgi:hypothetical protein